VEEDILVFMLLSLKGSHGDSKNPQNYNPNPADMTNLTLSKEMMNVAERLSEDAHDIQVSFHKKSIINLR